MIDAVRQRIEEDCNNIVRNINDYLGKFYFVNYDIGTGKSYHFANIIPRLVRKGKKVLVLVYSYNIAHEWQANIRKAWRKSYPKDSLEKINASICKLSSPTYMSRKECKHKNKYNKEMGIGYFVKTVCMKKRCNIHNSCLKDFKKTSRKAKVVITSDALYGAHLQDILKPHVYIYDEITSFESTVDIRLQYNDKNLERAKPSLMESIEYLSEYCINKHNDDYLKKHLIYLVRKSTVNIQTDDQSKYWVELKISRRIRCKLKAILERLYKCPQYYKLKKRINVLQHYINALAYESILYIVPHSYVYIDRMDSTHKYVYRFPLGQSIICKKRFELKGLGSSLPARERAAHFVLGATYDKEYIENIFKHKAIRIPKEQSSGCIFQNRVIAINYMRWDKRKSGRKQDAIYAKRGPTLPYFISNNGRASIIKVINAFVERFAKEKIAIGGSKKYIDEIRDELPQINLMPYDEFKKLRINNSYNKVGRRKVVPYLHYGISGTNQFKDYRAILIISSYRSNILSNPLYSSEKRKRWAKFNINQEVLDENLNIAKARQLEGRLLRFSKKVKYKYIFRFNSFDTSGYINPIMKCKTQQTFIKFIKREYQHYNDFISKKLKRNINADCFSSLKNMKAARRRKLTFIASKFIEYYYSQLEKGLPRKTILELAKTKFWPKHLKRTNTTRFNKDIGLITDLVSPGAK